MEGRGRKERKKGKVKLCTHEEVFKSRSRKDVQIKLINQQEVGYFGNLISPTTCCNAQLFFTVL